jgi:hypothetical protein
VQCSKIIKRRTWKFTDVCRAMIFLLKIVFSFRVDIAKKLLHSKRVYHLKCDGVCTAMDMCLCIGQGKPIWSA